MNDPRIPNHYWAVKFLPEEEAKVKELAQKRRDSARQFGYGQKAGGIEHEIVGMAG